MSSAHIIMYHGTSSKWASKILKDGIRPRGTTSVRGNWEHTVPSKMNLVYLTQCYPFHFAGAATKDEKGECAVIFECRVPVSRCYPDEDILAQAHVATHGGNLDEVTATIDPTEYQPLTQFSLEQIGNVSIPHVKRMEITKMVVFKPGANLLQYQDAVISYVNHRIKGDYYKKVCEYLFDSSLPFPKDPYSISALFPEAPKEMIAQEQAYYDRMNTREDFVLHNLTDKNYIYEGVVWK